MIKFFFYLSLTMILAGAGISVAYNGWMGLLGLCGFLLGCLILLLDMSYDLEKNITEEYIDE